MNQAELFRASLRLVAAILIVCASTTSNAAEGARLLRQPDLSSEHIVFAHGGDLWVAARNGGDARRLTSTAAVESNPVFSPDGETIAFSSNRSGVNAVYVVATEGGTPERLTWYPADSFPCGFTPDGSRVLYASTRATAPTGYDRLWTVSIDGGPSERVPAPWGHRGAYASDGKSLVVDRVRRWDSEWRHYRGGQNTPLVLLDLNTLDETLLPNADRSTDIQPVWMGGTIYFLSDREWSMNVFAYEVSTGSLRQVTDFDDVDVKWLAGHDGALIIERNGFLHLLDPGTGEVSRVDIRLVGDFPWMETRWEDVSARVRWSELSPTGKRALFEARGEVFSVPVEKGSTRNLTRTSGAADRAPVWSPDGAQIAWFSDPGDGYRLMIADQDGLSDSRSVSIGESKMAWEATWSPDGKHIAFVDDDVRVRVLTLEDESIVTADVAGVNIERGRMGLRWSPDSKWLAYSKSHDNHLRRIVVWSLDSGETAALTDPMADSMSPAWGRDGKHLFFLASTDVALGSGWANTRAINADPSYGVYATVLRTDDASPFPPESDEEPVTSESDDDAAEGPDKDKKKGKKGKKGKAGADDEKEKDGSDDAEKVEVKVDLDGIARRIIALPMPVARYAFTVAGPSGSVFVGERVPDGDGSRLHKFSLKDREAKVFIEGATSVSPSADGEKLLVRTGRSYKVIGTGAPPGPDAKPLGVSLRMKLDRGEEWRQMFDEAWRYQRDFFYDPDMHGRDWDLVRERYAPLVEHVRHRADLNYVLDQMNGELSVGHSFVFGGDMPETRSQSVGLLGADLEAAEDRWRVARIYTFESWNPRLQAPLDRPGLKIEEGHYVLAVDGRELTAAHDPYRLLDGTVGRQTVLHVNERPTMEGSWTVTVEPVSSERTLRQRGWVEDNRRTVDELSDGKLAYVWVPNTGQPGVVSFDRYFFAQQDRLGAVIDERFNGGGLLDDYMVDLMTRKLRAGITNEVPGGKPFRLPAGILGPKVLLINELAGSGGDFFPWVFRQQQAGPLIGQRTWGGVVKSSVHYPLVDGGALTAPDNAVFDPIKGRWVGENVGIPPDIEVRMDARTVAAGRDPQLEAGVRELLRLLERQPPPVVEPPEYSSPASR